MRKYVIAGNWKMNKTPAEATALINDLKPLVAGASCDVVVGVPFVDLPAALEATKGTAIGVAAQNCHWEKSGAFTGEVSAEMLKRHGSGLRDPRPQRAPHVFRRHRRHRAEAGARRPGCRPDRHPLRGRDTWSSGSRASPARWWPCRPKSPWAASPPRSWPASSSRMSPSGPSAPAAPLPRPAGERGLRTLSATRVAQLYSWEIADDLVIQYGGSMNAGNAAELLAQPDVDGGLIGGASLKPADFAAIVSAAK